MTIKEIMNANPQCNIVEIYSYKDILTRHRKSLNCVNFIQDNQTYYLNNHLINYEFNDIDFIKYDTTSYLRYWDVGMDAEEMFEDENNLFLVIIIGKEEYEKFAKQI